MKLKIKKLRDVKTPTRGTSESAGLDFYIPNDYIQTTISSGESVNIPSGITIDLPHGYMLTAANRSSMGKIGALYGAQVVDSDYTGEIHLNIWNVSNEDITFSPGQKVMQFILIPIVLFDIEEVDNIEKVTERGNGGFGSTNKK